MTKPGRLVDIECVEDVAYIRLENPERHNTLTLPLLEQLLECLQIASNKKELVCVVLQASGKSFSTGGDINAFLEHKETLEQYSHELVGLLNQTILFMFAMRIPIIARVHGPATGGSLGLILASDLVAVSDSAFFAPYYTDVGFAPDGGWTAILPKIIGGRKALEIQLLNLHVSAQEAKQLHIATQICKEEDLDEQIKNWIKTLRTKVPQSLEFTKSLVQDALNIAEIAAALEKERQAFIRCINTPAALAGMKQFVKQFHQADSPDVKVS